MENIFASHVDKQHFLTRPFSFFVQVKKIGESMSFQKYGSKLNRKPYLGCEKYVFGSDDYWRCCIKGYTSSLQHQVRI